MCKNIFLIWIIVGIIFMSGCTTQQTSQPVIIYKVSYTTSTQFPIIKILDSVKIKNSEIFPKELDVSNFKFIISDAKFNITADGKKIYLSINVKYLDNEISQLWGKNEVVDTICDIVFDQSPTATCAPIHGILINRQTNKEFNGQPVYIHNTDNVVEITEIGSMSSSKTWSYFVISGIERHEVYKTLD